MEKYVYLFNEGNKDMRELLGGKGANLAEMVNIGLPVPMGFTITTEACNKYYLDDGVLDEKIIDEIFLNIDKLEDITNKKFGDKNKPLLLSVRSGARASMPGMMDTILTLGLNDEIVSEIANKGNGRFIYDAYRRLISMYANVVKGLDLKNFEEELEEAKKVHHVLSDQELDEEMLKVLVNKYKDIYKNLSGEEFPISPREQLIEAIKAVFRSWNNDRAKYYRKLNNIPDDWGTAVNVQMMVFGNLNENSGTGVAFTRDPATGEDKLYGEYLINALGEDVVAGIRTPEDISKLKEVMPKIYDEFYKIAKTLESHYKDMQDMEFTIEDGKLYILQTRSGKRTASAAVKIAVSLVNEGMISREDAIMRIDASVIDNLLHLGFSEDSKSAGKVIGKGIAASPGAGVGKIYFEASEILKRKDEDTILVRLETSPEDIEGMHHAKGVVTLRGGKTSHAAVVARGLGICCVSGVSDIVIDEDKKTLTTSDGHVYHEGDIISVDGATGLIYDGALELREADISGDFKTFMDYTDSVRRLRVRANADTEHDALIAKRFGAEGIGLCRTEHMFFDKMRIFSFRKMIISTTPKERDLAIKEILPYQRSDFEALFKVMAPYKVNIRLLDPPLHEFLPKTNTEINELANLLKISFADLKTRIGELKEFNPMMGHRGCRLAITYPDIAKMQVRAIIEAAINVTKDGKEVKPEIMIPLVGTEKELSYLKRIIDDEAKLVMKENRFQIEYAIGTMIEVPRACVIADKLAENADFFSFGTNDLTQMVYGYSRDDAGKFLNVYYDKNILDFDPFEKIDTKGVGEFVRLAAEKSRKANPKIELGICGEHGGEESSVIFFNNIGLDYVSCSPYRVPIAKLAAARAVILEKNK